MTTPYDAEWLEWDDDTRPVEYKKDNMPLSCHCGAEVTGYHMSDCGYYTPPKERAMSIEVSAQGIKQSKISDLVGRFHSEVERQNMAVENLTKTLSPVMYHGPEESVGPQSAIAEIATDSELVINLRDILLAFQRNTDRINSLHDRIEL